MQKILQKASTGMMNYRTSLLDIMEGIVKANTTFFTYFQYLSQRFERVYFKWPKINFKKKKKATKLFEYDLYHLPLNAQIPKHCFVELMSCQYKSQYYFGLFMNRGWLQS